MNRAIAALGEGSFVLRPGRVYRMLVVVNGETTVDDLEASMAALGFDPSALASSPPRHWAAERPHDWPDEDPPPIAANECLVRVSGALTTETPIAIERDMPVDGGSAVFTVAQAWDYAPALHERSDPLSPRTGARAPAAKPDRTFVLIVGVAVGAAGLWALGRRRKRREREEERLLSELAREQQAALASRVQALITAGHGREQAEALAEAEALAGPGPTPLPQP